MGSKKEVLLESKAVSKKTNNDSTLEFNDSENTNKPPPIISVKSISKTYKKKLILEDISFNIDEKDIFGIIGMSGSGKTTLFQAMAGIIGIDSGDIHVRRNILFKNKTNQIQPDFVSVYKAQKQIHKKFGFASQIPSFYDHLSVKENLLLFASLHHLSKKTTIENIIKLLKLVDLSDQQDSLASELSGGMRRRLDIACSLINNPKVLFLDEPTSDLDPVMRKQIWMLIKNINKFGTTVVIASHIIEEVEKICSKVAIIHDKRILGSGSISELKSLFKKSQQIRVVLKDNNYKPLIAKLEKDKSIERFVVKLDKIIIFVPPDKNIMKRVFNIVDSVRDQILSIDISDATLAEIFEALARRNKKS